MSYVQVSPSELVFNCTDGELLPANAFECQPIWLEMLQQTAEMSHQWSAFILPIVTDGRVARVSQVLLRSNADPEGRKSKAMDALLLEHTGHESQGRAIRGHTSEGSLASCVRRVHSSISHYQQSSWTMMIP